MNKKAEKRRDYPKKIFAISDIHLPESHQVKRFNFPPDYFEQIRAYLAQFDPDVLLIGGDLVWGHSIKDGDVQKGLNRIRSLPGKIKLFIDGNHDLWLYNLGVSYEESQNIAYDYFSGEDFYYIGGRSILLDLGDGTKLGICGAQSFLQDIGRKRNMEVDRFELEQLESLQRAINDLKEKINNTPTVDNICLVHYPPTWSVLKGITPPETEKPFRMILDSSLFSKVIFGHVHMNEALLIYKKLYNIELFCTCVERINFMSVRIPW